MQIGATGDLGFGDGLTKFTVAYATGNTGIAGDLTITGNLTVNGATTTINSTTLTVDDLNIVVASGAADGAAANGAGITVDGANATLTWDNANPSWDSSEDFNLASGKAYYINDASVLNSTTLGSAVVNSSLQQLGTIATGTWQATIIDPTYGGTGVNNGSKTITLGGNLTHTGAHTLGLTTTGATSITLPTSGTLAIIGDPLSQFASTTSAQLAGVISDETGTGALVFGTSPTMTTSIVAGSATMGLLDTTATTINFGGAATAIDIGATTGTTSVNNNLDVDLDLNVDGGDFTTNQGTFNLLNTTATTVNAFGAATDINIGAATGDFGVANATANFAGNLFVNGNTLDTDETGTFNLLKDNATTLAMAQAATEIVIGETKAAANLASALGEMIVRLDLRTNADMYIDGDLFVSQINDTPIGNVTPSTGAFTTLTANNFVTFTEATNATSNSSAAVIISGGLAVVKDIRADNFIGDIDAQYITSGSIADARITSSSITQHQADITGTGILNSGSISTGFGNINIGTSIFTGDGSGITTLNASNLSSGTVPDARIAATSIVQHQGSITGTGALNSGSITSGFGSINIGTDTFTGNGSGLTSLNASNLSTGTVSGSRLGGNQSMAGVKTFSDTSASTNTTTGAVRVGGGLGVAGDIYGGSFNGNGSGLTDLNANNLGSGTVPNARVSGTYSNLTGTGALNAGEITSGFGNINIGTSTFTGNGSGLTSVDATTLDGVDSTAFLRSNADDTTSGMITISKAGNEMLRLQDTDAAGDPYMSFYQSTTRAAYIQFVDSGNRLRLYNDTSDDYLDIRSGANGLEYAFDGTAYTVWHSGNDGAGSGLNADQLDGLSSGSFIRADANDSFTGTLSGTGSISISGNISATSFSGDGSGLSGISADDANTLDGIDSTGFLRTGGNNTATATILFSNSGTAFRGTQGTMGDNDQWRFGGAATSSNAGYLEAATGDDGTEPHYHRQYSGTFTTLTRTATILDGSGNTLFPGEVTAYSSDARLKTNIENIPNALDKVKALNGVLYNWTDEGHKWGLDVDTEKREVGLLAQEVQEVLPEAVAPAPFDLDDEQNSRSGKDYLTVKYERIAPVLIEAIKEQQKEIDELKSMVQKLLDK